MSPLKRFGQDPSCSPPPCYSGCHALGTVFTKFWKDQAEDRSFVWVAIIQDGKIKQTQNMRYIPMQSRYTAYGLLAMGQSKLWQKSFLKHLTNEGMMNVVFVIKIIIQIAPKLTIHFFSSFNKAQGLSGWFLLGELMKAARIHVIYMTKIYWLKLQTKHKMCIIKWRTWVIQ